MEDKMTAFCLLLGIAKPSYTAAFLLTRGLRPSNSLMLR